MLVCEREGRALRVEWSVVCSGAGQGEEGGRQEEGWQFGKVNVSKQSDCSSSFDQRFAICVATLSLHDVAIQQALEVS